METGQLYKKRAFGPMCFYTPRLPNVHLMGHAARPNFGYPRARQNYGPKADGKGVSPARTYLYKSLLGESEKPNERGVKPLTLSAALLLVVVSASRRLKNVP